MAELRVLDTPAVEVEKDVVRILEGWLERSRNGELAAVGICGVLSDRLTSSTELSASQCFPALIGAASILLAEMTHEAVASSEPE